MNFGVTSRVKCVANALAIAEGETKLDGDLATLDCSHLKNSINFFFKTLFCILIFTRFPKPQCAREIHNFSWFLPDNRP